VNFPAQVITGFYLMLTPIETPLFLSLSIFCVMFFVFRVFEAPFQTLWNHLVLERLETMQHVCASVLWRKMKDHVLTIGIVGGFFEDRL
jgi:hypothetical protein